MKPQILLILLLLGFYTSNSQEQMKLKILNSTTTPVFTSNNFKSVAIDKDSAVWAGTQYGGLYVLNPKTQTWAKSSYLTNVFINDIKAHPKGGVYIAQSGTIGSAGGEGNRQGGVVKFDDYNFNGYVYWASNGTGSQSNGGLNSRMARSVWIDTNSINTPDINRDRLWVTQNSFLTGNNTVAGGIAIGTNPPGMWHFSKRTAGLQVFPNTNLVSARTPSVDAICGNKDEVWVSVRQNYGGSEILRYSSRGATFLGGFSQNGQFDATRRVYSDDTQTLIGTASKDILRPGFRVNAMYNDAENRKWIGMASGSGGLIVIEKGIWSALNLSGKIADGFGVNINAITEDEYGNIYFGTSHGLLVFDGSFATNANSYKLYSTLNGLPSNNINGIAYDSAGKNIVLATDAGIAVWDIKKPVDISLAWDFSFPKPAIKPKGVAADGVSRLYINIKKNSDTLPKIEQIAIRIKNVVPGYESLMGRVMPALFEDMYSDEAKNAKDFTAVRFSPNNKDEWKFWYRSPEDFCLSENGQYFNDNTRTEEFDIFVDYETGRKDTIQYKLKIVRPPLVLVHGLASNPECWNNLEDYYNSSLILNSPRFKYTKALTLDGAGAYEKNARTLLSGSSPTESIRTNSLQYNIDQLRQMGYASNQVDYLSHSMGGLVIRYAQSEFTNEFNANHASVYPFNNYGMGFVHKYITINSPHNSSPLADLVYDVAPALGLTAKFALGRLYINNSEAQQPFDFLRPDVFGNDLGSNFTIWNYYPTDAIKNLQIRSNSGGVNLKETPFKNHLIVGDMDDSYKLLVEPIFNKIDAVENTADVIEKFGNIYPNKFSQVISLIKTVVTEIANEQFRDIGALFKNDPEYNTFLLEFMKKKDRKDRLYYFLNWYSARLGVDNYMDDGDLIVPIKSQLANKSASDQNVTFYRSSPNTYDAMHIEITKRVDVGTRVIALLNSKVNDNPLFANSIPANNDEEPKSLGMQKNKQYTSSNTKMPVQNENLAIFHHLSKNKIFISNPNELRTIKMDSTYTIKIGLTDTANLAYFKINGIDSPTYVFPGDFSKRNFSFKTSGKVSSKSFLFVNAVYDLPDGVHYFIDTLNIELINEKPVKGFRVIEDEVTVEHSFRPSIQVKYDSIWLSISPANSDLSVTIDSTAFVSFADSVGTFYAKKNGVAVATISYKGFSDELTLIMAMAPEPECFNKTIKAGNMSDPSVWSKNRIPIECDSLLILHNLLIDTAVKVKAMQVSPGVEVRIKANLKGFKIGYNYKMNENQMILKEMILPQDFRKGYYYKSKTNIA